MTNSWEMQGVSALEAYSNARHHPEIISVANFLCTARAGLPYEVTDIEAQAARLADVAELHGINPDVMAMILIEEEPVLGQELPFEGDSLPDA